MRGIGKASLLTVFLGGCGLFSGPSVGTDCGKAPACMLEIPGGTFLMGAQSTDPTAPRYDPLARPDEGPVRSVTVDSFWIQGAEVAFRDWDWCVQRGKCKATGPDGPTPGMGSLSELTGSMTWDEARGYCESLGARLPTEAEWEYVARSGDDRLYQWGDTPPCALGTPDNPFQNLPRDEWAALPGCTAASVGPHENGKFGAFNLVWGHWEWVADWYDPAGYVGAASSNPTGPKTGTQRVQRGGSWAADQVVDHRNTARMSMPPDARVFDVGVRCAY